MVVATLAVLTLIIDKGLRKSGYDQYGVWNAIYDSKINADLIILGSSRAQSQINPIILDSTLNMMTYNLGMSGYGFDMGFTRLKVYLKYNKKPKYIIQTIDYGDFGRGKELPFKDQFIPYLSDKLLFNELASRGLPTYYKYFPFIKYHESKTVVALGVLEYFHLKHFPDRKIKGYFLQPRQWNPAAFELQKQKKEKILIKYDKRSIKLFEEMLDWGEKNDIKIFIVFTPKYYELLQMEAGYEELHAVVERLSKQYHAPILNYYFDPLCSNTNYFHNAMHLNDLGARYFTEKLGRDIKSLLQKN